MSELKPCPLCGQEPFLDRMNDGQIYSHCTTKGCAMRNIDFISTKWNTRPIEAALQSRIDILTTRLAAIHEAALIWETVVEEGPEAYEQLRFILAKSAPDETETK
jgi:hypothetical protein